MALTERDSPIPSWILTAAEEIAGDPNCCDIQSSCASLMERIIAKHVPATAEDALEAIREMPDQTSDIGDMAWERGYNDGRTAAFLAVKGEIDKA